MSIESQKNLLKLIEKSKKHLQEDETRKSESLRLFREWLNRHPYIKRCRNDDNFLLQFLRTRKYSISDAFNTFEKHFLLREKRPEWFDASPRKIERIKDLARVGFHYVLSDLERNGEATYVVNTERFNLEKYGPDDAFGSAYLTAGIGFESEITQHLGVFYVLDYSATDKNYFAMGTPKVLYDWATSLDAMPGKYKKIFVIGLSPIYYTILNIVKMALTDKMRNRLYFLKDPKDLSKHISPMILPKKFGGIKTESEMIENYLQRVDKFADKLRESNDYEIDVIGLTDFKQKKINNSFSSFRKLEVD
ncbi:hypothetical protein PVAND_000110 [Polypedilum vanderplanki]|uniref:CRAL-TRIO domain-containing protein n=1 Tax=Polypedilum vanderplanki TaxID=319348 RepID=A0A9J6BIU7_POLVA|nr:hypothetical protein PVAND_000110 [Polypedilum vanderplanki]